MSDKEGIEYKSEQEMKESADNLVGFFEILIETDQEEKARKHRLIAEPKGFSLEANGRNCSLCGRGIYEGNGWYDKWGFKCMNCQDAINKKKIPGSLCGDYKNEKYITDSSLSYKAKLHVQTIRKLVRQGKIKARQIPNGPYLIIRKNNPNIKTVLEAEQKIQNTKSK